MLENYIIGCAASDMKMNLTRSSILWSNKSIISRMNTGETGSRILEFMD